MPHIASKRSTSLRRAQIQTVFETIMQSKQKLIFILLSFNASFYPTTSLFLINPRSRLHWGGCKCAGTVVLARTICHNYNMLRQLSRVLWFGAHSLRQCTYSRPQEVEWLRQKFYGNSVWASKLEYLSKLERESGLRYFFDDKSIDLLSEEEIYFLFNSTIDYRLGQRARQEIMAKISSSYFLCLLAKEFRWVDEVEQSLIILRFNQELADLQPREIAFCLEIISEFSPQELKVEQEALHRRLLYFLPVEDHTYHLILIAGYLLEMGMQPPEIINKRNFQHWFATNDNFDFRAIYFLYKLSEKLEYPLQQAQLNTLKTHMKDAILNLHLNYFEQNYVVFLLQYYPQYLKILNILHFTPRAYIGYLLFFKQNPHVKVTEHKIPQSVVELTDFVSFRTIIDLRMNLALDNLLSLAKTLPHYFAHSLKAVNSFISYLRESRIDDVEVHFLVEKAVTQKLRLGQDFSLEIAETFSVDEVLNMLAQLARNGLCSVDFWKKIVKLLERMIEIRLHSKIIESSNDNYTNLLSIASSKNFTEQTRQTIYQELISLLSRSSNEWTMKQIVKLTKILAANRIGEDQIVLLIERRVMRMLQSLRDPRAVMGETMKDNLSKLIISLNSLEKGSYKFWSQVSQLLDGKTKKDILNRIKNPKSLAHTYLTSIQSQHY